MNAARAPWHAPERAFDARRVPALRLLLCALVVLALGALLAQRADRLARDVERESVRWTVRALRASVVARALALRARGDAAACAALVGSNPVALLDRAPAGYVGASTEATPPEPGAWRFDSLRRELVYSMREERRADAAERHRVVIRFKITGTAADNAASADAAIPTLVATAAPPWLESSIPVGSQPTQERGEPR